MLVLSRKKDESIVIDKEIEITILEINGSTVRIGIKAPKKIKVLRKELIEEVSNTNIISQVDIKEINLEQLVKNLKRN
ncbi:MAG: carbon storage regulator [Clostridia bacterium]